MRYRVQIAPKALRQLEKVPARERDRIARRVDSLAGGLEGDVKRLKSFSPAYRLRVGDYRVLFDVEGGVAIIHRVGHRKDIYDRP